MEFNVFIVFVLHGIKNGLSNKNSEISQKDGKPPGLISTSIFFTHACTTTSTKTRMAS